MAISTVEEKEIPEHYQVFTVVKAYAPGFTAATDVVIKAGHHPKCRLVDVAVIPLVFDTAGDTFIVEDGDANDASVVATTAANNAVVKGVIIESQVFERNESINILSTKGNANNADIVALMFESVH